MTLAHGGGGKAMHDLIDDVFLGASTTRRWRRWRTRRAFPIADLARYGDRLAFTTDSYVVDPLFFPGGDIGKLAVCGTVNDLAVGGATPLYLSAARLSRKACRSTTAAPDRASRWLRRRSAGRRRRS